MFTNQLTCALACCAAAHSSARACCVTSSSKPKELTSAGKQYTHKVELWKRAHSLAADAMLLMLCCSCLCSSLQSSLLQVQRKVMMAWITPMSSTMCIAS